MDGIINHFKPTGITSAQALYRVRKVTGQRKSGHAGTLDPGASGVLVLCMGKATKLVESIMDEPKVYHAVARLDVTSQSLDSDSPLVPIHVPHPPGREEVARALAGFEGEIQQVPPQISALKVGGVPAYKRARRGTEVTLSARPVRVYWLHLIGYSWPGIEFQMCCGRGTYVRGIVRDLGSVLGTGGCLTALARTSVGPFVLSGTRSLQAIEQACSPQGYLIGLEEAKAMLIPGGSPPPQRPISVEVSH